MIVDGLRECQRAGQKPEAPAGFACEFENSIFE